MWAYIKPVTRSYTYIIVDFLTTQPQQCKRCVESEKVEKAPRKLLSGSNKKTRFY